MIRKMSKVGKINTLWASLSRNGERSECSIEEQECSISLIFAIFHHLFGPFLCKIMLR